MDAGKKWHMNLAITTSKKFSLAYKKAYKNIGMITLAVHSVFSGTLAPTS